MRSSPALDIELGVLKIEVVFLNTLRGDRAGDGYLSSGMCGYFFCVQMC